ncbi:plasmid pRiA4b ORF-3 family protein [Arthrobacter sp. Y81]|uniref:plasmid pRiA4b ORF-3 family protein n=1 Tax=Arthrobacter sp. Y81 TaxID=2058897 RepID=UPI002157A4B8|nr:plasmid pRiA4b ORF-3 family protein [Arthrobacter sp. Y81]
MSYSTHAGTSLLPGRQAGGSLEQLLGLGSGAIFYEYDFGDSRLHRLELFPVGQQTKALRRTG